MSRTRLDAIAEELSLVVELGKACRDAYGVFSGVLDAADACRRTLAKQTEELEKARAAHQGGAAHPGIGPAIDEWQAKLVRASAALESFCSVDKRPGRLGAKGK